MNVLYLTQETIRDSGGIARLCFIFELIDIFSLLKV